MPWPETIFPGDKYGFLTILKRAERDLKWRMSKYECVCKCGQTCTVHGRYLRKAKTPNCGCLHYQLVSKAVTKYRTVADYLANTKLVNGCREWQGHCNNKGYATAGRYRGKHTEYKEALVHRRVFKLLTGLSPEVIMHTCDNPKCIKPKHLKGATQAINIQDSVRKGRMPRRWK